MSKNFIPIEPLDDGCVLGKKQTGKNPYWYVRMYWKSADKPQSEYKSTKILYEDSRASRLKAKRKANAIWQEFLAAVSAGDSPRKARTVKSVADAYKQKIHFWAEENERTGKDIYIIKGGRQVEGHSPYWTVAKAKAVDNILGHLEEFWPTLPTQDFRKITQRDLAYFSEWAAKKRDWSPSWTDRVITQIRMIWRFAFDEGWADFIPSPFRPPSKLKERARRNLTEEEWLKMVYWAKENYNQIQPTNKAAQYFKDSAFQFWIWLNVISWSGVRPSVGRVEKNLLRWEDIVDGPNKTRIIQRRDKTQYEAAILPNCYPLLDGLKKWQKDRGLEDCPYLFAHTRDKNGFWKKGDPIKTFKKQWETMLKGLDLWEDWGTAQSEKLVPYSLRGFFITMSLRNGVDAQKLANSLGTSVRVINQTYYDFRTEKEIDELIKRSGVGDIGTLSYDEDGYPILS